MHRQLDLFGSEPRVLTADARGSIVYHPAVLATGHAAELFAELHASVPWRSERRMMYEREVDVPRLAASMPIDERLPRSLADVLPIVEVLAQATFTHIGLNLYRDGHDSVAPHNDSIPELTVGSPIGLLSLGATRHMSIRSKGRPRRALDLDLDGGSLLVMSYEIQRHYDHGIAKTAGAVGPRISVAFRSRPPV